MLFLRNAEKTATLKMKTLTNTLDKDAWCTILLIKYIVSSTDLG